MNLNKRKTTAKISKRYWTTKKISQKLFFFQRDAYDYINKIIIKIRILAIDSRLKQNARLPVIIKGRWKLKNVYRKKRYTKWSIATKQMLYGLRWVFFFATTKCFCVSEFFYLLFQFSFLVYVVFLSVCKQTSALLCFNCKWRYLYLVGEIWIWKYREFLWMRERKKERWRARASESQRECNVIQAVST